MSISCGALLRAGNFAYYFTHVLLGRLPNPDRVSHCPIRFSLSPLTLIMWTTIVATVVPWESASANADAVWSESSYTLRQYKPNYFLPAYRSNEHDVSGDTWAKWQISFSYPLLDVRRRHIPDGKPVIAYTLEAWWRLYEYSAPFDEFDHNPEAFYEGVWQVKGHRIGLRTGWEHQSTGVASDSSRSWNRIFVEAKYRWRSFNVYVRPWWVANVGEFSEGIKKAADFGGSSFGAKLIAVYKSDRSRDAVTVWSGGAFELEATYRFFSENFYFYGQLHVGKMESLINYDVYQKAGGLGIALMK